MKEIEVLMKLNEDIEIAKSKLTDFEFIGAKKILDIYYVDELRDDLKPVCGNSFKKVFRLRRKDDKNLIAYKINHFNEKNLWEYAEEYETEVQDFDKIKKIIELLNLKELVKVENIKHTFVNSDYEIVVEDVKDLGYFLEVEKLNCPDDANVKQEKQKIRDFISSLGFDANCEINLGKPEMMLEKININ